MRLTKISFVVLLIACCVDSCVNQPEYSFAPRIELLDITFRRGDASKAAQDTLTFKLRFTDGDGDLGAKIDDPNSLDSNNPWYFFYNSTNLSAILYGIDPSAQVPAGYKIINYQAKRTITQFDTLPPLVCGSWELLRNSQNQPTDTVYIRQNFRAYNVNVDVYAKNSTGTYEPYNYAAQSIDKCSYNVFRATFPDLSNDGQRALDGLITFRLTSFDLFHFFNTRTLKMDITINDRAYHMSNTVEKKDFTIAEISK